jgi:hypothetical protein
VPAAKKRQVVMSWFGVRAEIRECCYLRSNDSAVKL